MSQRDQQPNTKRGGNPRAAHGVPPISKEEFSKHSRYAAAPGGRPKTVPFSDSDDAAENGIAVIKPASAEASSMSAYSRKSGNYSHKNSYGKGPSKVLIGVLIALVVLLVGAGTAAALYLKSIDENLAGNKTSEEQLAIEDALVASTNYNEPFYMLLLGSDARESNASMGARSDTCIAARIDPITNTVTLISIPRDTRIYINGSGPYKFNAAYSFNGTAGAIAAASELLGVEISHYAEVNFSSLREFIDALGGVVVDVPYTINDSKAGSSVIEEGEQTLNGRQALTFARSRQYVDGDFTRTSNQRLLISAVVDRLFSLSASQLPGIVQEAAKCLSTDMSAIDLFSLVLALTDDPVLPGTGEGAEGEGAEGVEGGASDSSGAPDSSASTGAPAEGTEGEGGEGAEGSEAEPAKPKYTVYSVMVPSSTATIDGISYVLTDEAGLAAVMEAVEAGLDPNDVVTSGAKGSAYDKEEEQAQ